MAGGGRVHLEDELRPDDKRGQHTGERKFKEKNPTNAKAPRQAGRVPWRTRKRSRQSRSCGDLRSRVRALDVRFLLGSDII